MGFLGVISVGLRRIEAAEGWIQRFLCGERAELADCPCGQKQLGELQAPRELLDRKGLYCMSSGACYLSRRVNSSEVVNTKKKK